MATDTMDTSYFLFSRILPTPYKSNMPITSKPASVPSTIPVHFSVAFIPYSLVYNFNVFSADNSTRNFRSGFCAGFFKTVPF